MHSLRLRVSDDLKTEHPDRYLKHSISIAPNLHLFPPTSSTSCSDFTRFRIAAELWQTCRGSRTTSCTPPKPTSGNSLRCIRTLSGPLVLASGLTSAIVPRVEFLSGRVDLHAKVRQGGRGFETSSVFVIFAVQESTFQRLDAFWNWYR